MGELWRRIWYFLNRSRIERELQEEMAAHREAMGEPRRFGNVLKLREESRDVWGFGWLDRTAQDIRHAARVLRRAPAFSITSILILTAGIGLNLTFFHLMNVLLVRPTALKDPATLVRFWRRGPTFTTSGMPYPATQFIREHNSVLSAVLTQVPSTVVWDGETAKINVSFVSPNWFAELGYGAALGRTFDPAIDERPDAAPAAVVSYQFWRTRLGSDPQAVGRPLRLNDHPITVVGVAPLDFPDLQLENPKVWIPINQIDYINPGTPFKHAWNEGSTAFYGRIRDGVSPQAAVDSLGGELRALAELQPNHFKNDEWFDYASAEGRFLHWRERLEVLTLAGLIGALTLLVLIVASANLGNLVLSHVIGRVRELSVRVALGATRTRIARHILVECALLGVPGALGGVALSYIAARLFAARVELPPYLDFSPDAALFAAALVTAFVAMLVFGLAPAWMVSRRDLTRAMKDGGQQASAGLARARFRLALVAAQVIGCCALLVVAGAMARGLQRLLVADPGFAYERVAVLDASTGRSGATADASRAYWLEVAGIVRAHPAVAAAALCSPTPLGNTISQSGYGADSGSLTIINMVVDGSFFDVMEIPFVAGRTFEPGDDAATVIISRRVATTMYGTLEVVGKGYPRSTPTRTIVGVVGDAMVVDLRVSNTGEEYRPLQPRHMGEAVLVARARGDAAGLVAPLRAAAKAADPRVLPQTVLLRNAYEIKLQVPRLASTIAGLVAMLVLVLACLGIFGVVAYAVKLRTREIGIRRALGADSRRVITALLRQLSWPVVLGVVVGTAVGLAASVVLAGQPFYLAIADATTPLAALTVFALAALTAALIPASRALRTDPVQALRHE